MLTIKAIESAKPKDKPYKLTLKVYIYISHHQVLNRGDLIISLIVNEKH